MWLVRCNRIRDALQGKHVPEMLWRVFFEILGAISP